MRRYDDIYVGCRINKKDKKLIDEYCKARGEDFSSFLRLALYVKMAKLGLLQGKRAKLILLGELTKE